MIRGRGEAEVPAAPKGMRLYFLVRHFRHPGFGIGKPDLQKMPW